ncbi:MFS transporter [Chloroflexota bacterium]
MTESKQPRLFYGYVVVFAGFCILMLAWGAFLSFGVFFESILIEFGWTRATTSTAYALAILLNGLLSIGMGRLNDRFGPRVVMTGCSLSLGLGFLLMSQISSLWQLYILYGALIGIGISGTFVPLSSVVARWFVKRRGMMTGIILAGQGLGILVIPPIVSQLIVAYGWRISYVIVGIFTLLLLLLVSQLLKRDPSKAGQLPYGESESSEDSSNAEASGFSLRESTHTRQFWMLCVVFFAIFFCLGVIMVHVVIHATGLGVPATTAASVLGVTGGVSIFGRIIIGSASDRIGNRLAFITGFILMLIALLWLAVAKDTWMLFLCAVIFGFGYGGLLALLSPLTAELFGLRSHGVILGVLYFGGEIGETISPVLAGRIFDITSSYQLAFLISAAVIIIGTLLILFLRPIRRESLISNMK